MSESSLKNEKPGALESEGISDRVIGLIAKQLRRPAEDIRPDKDLTRDLNADSLDIVEIVMTMEEHFNLRIPDEEAEKLKTAGRFIDFIEKNLDSAPPPGADKSAIKAR